MNKPKIIVLIVAVALIGLGAWFWLGRVDEKIISQVATLHRVVFGDDKTEQAYLSLDYTADSQNYRYINIAIDLNKDGNFASYTQNETSQEEWVVQNMTTVIFANEDGNYDFQLTDLTVDEQKDFPAKIILTNKTLAHWQGEKLRGSSYQSLVIPAIELDDASTRMVAHPEGKGSASAFAQDEPIPTQDNVGDTAKTGGKTVATLGKEFEVFNGDVPDITQAKNECGPTSVANSMRWLAKKNGFTDKLPLSDKELLEEFKDDMKWDPIIGVLDENFIPGKEKFTSQHNLAIETHRVSAKDYDINIVAKIAQELSKGQDVEIGIEYWEKQPDGSSKVVGGHWVTAVGATGTRNDQTIFIHDPASPGPALLDQYKVDGTKIVDYRYRGDAVAHIQYAVAESPISPPPVTVPDDSTPTNSPEKTINTNTPAPIKKPVFSGNYSSVINDGITTINFKINPQDLAGKSFNGVELNHDAQGLSAPYASTIDLNLTGADQSDWACMCTGAKYRCVGSNTLQANTATTWSLSFDGEINLPADLNLDLLTDGEVTDSITVVNE